MKRLYETLIEDHVEHLSQMAFMCGPRQVGKTTVAEHICESHTQSIYLNWDVPEQRDLILKGASSVAEQLGLEQLNEVDDKPIVAFDEIHKFKKWKNYLKGHFDITKDDISTLVTGSAKLNIFKRGGDSLMGRYFLYRIHPFSIAECLHTELRDTELVAPKKIEQSQCDALYRFGGYPEPFLMQDTRFHNRWSQLRYEQLIFEDIRDANNLKDLAQLEILAKLVAEQPGAQMSYHNLAKKVQVSDKTAKNWIEILRAFYFCFTLKPWHKNIARSLTREPKCFLWDWSTIQDDGARFENFIASHLQKAVHYWTDVGFGKYELYYLRDKDKREVDFLVARDNKPWFIVEAKNSATKLSDNLTYFAEQTKAEHAFQVVYNLPYVERDCFEIKKPVVVPALTFLSQLV